LVAAKKDGAMLPTDLSPKAQQIIDRLAAIDYENPKICEQRIRDAFSRHLIALNLRDRFVEIYRSFYAALDAAWESTFDAEWEAAFEASRKAVLDTADEAARKAARDAVREVASDAVLEAVLEAALEVVLAAVSDAPHAGAFKSAFDAAYQTASDAAFNAALRVVRKPASNPLWNEAFNTVFGIAFSFAWSNAKNAVWDDVKKPGSGAAFQYARSAWADSFADSFRASWKPKDDYPSDRASKAAEEAAWQEPSQSAYRAARDEARNAAIWAAFDIGGNVVGTTGTETEGAIETAVICVNSTTSSPEHEQFCAVWMPLVDAVEAGLFCFRVTTTKVIALTLPVMRIEDDGLHRLHADGKPAVQWSDWECYYFWHGTEIPQKYGAVLSLDWRSQWLLEESNAELRRVLIQGIGYDRIVQDLEAVELDAWREYSLLKIQADIDVEPIYLLKMTCPSTNHIHVLRVPPHLISAREAIRWVNWDVDSETFAVET
jgi:hypothetical protein